MTGWIKCLFLGHKKGKATAETKHADGKTILRSYKCPRCPATWSRKVKA